MPVSEKPYSKRKCDTSALWYVEGPAGSTTCGSEGEADEEISFLSAVHAAGAASSAAEITRLRTENAGLRTIIENNRKLIEQGGIALEKAFDESSRLRELAETWYTADGPVKMSEAEVIEKRKAAALELVSLRDALKSSEDAHAAFALTIADANTEANRLRAELKQAGEDRAILGEEVEQWRKGNREYDLVEMRPDTPEAYGWSLALDREMTATDTCKALDRARSDTPSAPQAAKENAHGE